MKSGEGGVKEIARLSARTAHTYKPSVLQRPKTTHHVTGHPPRNPRRRACPLAHMLADSRCRPECRGPVHCQGPARDDTRPAISEPRQLLGVRPCRFGRTTGRPRPSRRIRYWLIISAQVRRGGFGKVVATDEGALPGLDRHQCDSLKLVCGNRKCAIDAIHAFGYLLLQPPRAPHHHRPGRHRRRWPRVHAYQHPFRVPTPRLGTANGGDCRTEGS